MPEWGNPYSQPVEGFSDPLTALESCWGLCWAGLVSSLVGLGGPLDVYLMRPPLVAHV